MGYNLMENLIIKQAIKLVLEPQSFKDLKKLNYNILAYGELEYLLGYHTGMFEDFRKLCNEVNDLKVALEFKEDIVKIITNNLTKELSTSIKINLELDGMFVALIHYINKKNNEYGINI